MMLTKGIKTGFRWYFALIPLIGLIQLTSKLNEHWLSVIWHVSLLTTALFYLACTIIPKTIRKLQSMPYTYYVSNNIGPAGLEAQLLTYASYHTHWYNHITHTAFPVEALLWQLVIYSYFYTITSSAIALIIMLFVSALLLLQAFSFKEYFFSLALSFYWLLVCFSVVVITSVFSPELAYRWSVILLLSLGFWRFTGHWVEPIPPAIMDNKSFIPLKKAGLNLTLMGATLLGFTSEFAAGLPFRLVNPWIYVGLQQRFPQMKFKFSWAETKKIRVLMHLSGWRAHPRTKQLIENESY